MSLVSAWRAVLSSGKISTRKMGSYWRTLEAEQVGFKEVEDVVDVLEAVEWIVLWKGFYRVNVEAD
jgi:hypothetical protein